VSVTPRTRQVVLERDAHACVRCGRYIAFRSYSLHHRRPRGSGGSKRPETNLPANLVVLCGHATSPDGCHYWAESNRGDAMAVGLILGQHLDPAASPVLTHRGWLLLDNDGTYTSVEVPA
jgi:hypothetical protein